MFKLFSFTSLFLGLILSSSFAYAQLAPNIEVSAAGNGNVRISVQQSGSATGYNVFFNDAYQSTHRLASGVNEIVFKGSPGKYCVSSFLLNNGSTQYSPCSASVTLSSTNSAPSAPGNFRSNLYSTTAGELFWDASIDEGIEVNYEITRDSQVIAITNGKSYFESNLQANRSYLYKIVAIDQQGLRSGAKQLTLRTSGGSESQPPPNNNDTSAPSVPSELSGTFYSRTAAEIFWAASSDNSGVAKYEVRRDGQVVSQRDGRSYFDASVNRSNSYFYEVVAIDFNGNRSNAAQLTLKHGEVNNNNVVEPPKQNDQLNLNIANARHTLSEGNASSLFIPFSIVRGYDNKRPVNLSLHAAHSSSDAEFLHQILPAQLSANESGAILEVRLGVAVAPLDFHERRFVIRANDGTNVVETPIVFDVKPIEAPDIYLLAGQSNMEGSSELGAKNVQAGGPDELSDRIKQLNVQPNSTSVFKEDWQFTDEYSNTSYPRYIRAEDPLHEPRAPQRNIKEATFVGMGLSFAKAALPNTTREIYLVPAAWSATGFCAGAQDGLAWNAESTAEGFLGGTLLADRALTRLNMTLRETGGVFRGILWHQGEADSNNRDCANRYGENLRKLVERFRTDALVDKRGAAGRGPNANIPFIVGSMSRGDDFRGAFSRFGATKLLVDTAHRTIDNNVPHSAFVNLDDLRPPSYPCGQGSCIHFGANAYRLIGSRYYAALRRIIGR